MLLIDAFNVLHLPQAVVVGRSLELADLASLIGTSRYAGQAAVLVCDGSGDGSIEAPRGKRARVRLAGVEVLFSGPGRSADDEIEARLRRGGGHGMIVVSDDRRLRRAASRVRAKSMASGVFLSHLLVSPGRDKKRAVPEFARDTPLDRYSIAHWMQEFGLTPGDLLERRGEAAKPGKAKSRPRGKVSGPGISGGKPRPEEVPRRAKLPENPVLPACELEDDPVIRAALEEWRGKLRVEDLDMGQWLEERGRQRRDR